MQEVYETLKGMILNAHSSQDHSLPNSTEQPQCQLQVSSPSHFAGGRVGGDASASGADGVIQAVRDILHLVLAR